MKGRLLRAAVVVGGAAAWRIVRERSSPARHGDEYEYPVEPSIVRVEQVAVPSKPVVVVDSSGQESLVETSLTVLTPVTVVEPVVASEELDAHGHARQGNSSRRRFKGRQSTGGALVAVGARISHVSLRAVLAASVGVAGTVFAVSHPISPMAWVAAPVGLMLTSYVWWAQRR